MKLLQHLFLNIINRKETANIIYEDEKVIAFMDKFPIEKGHFLVVPKIHSFNLFDIDNTTFSYLLKIAKKLAKERISKKLGFRLIVNSGEHANQKVFHTHVHIIPGKIK